jgi:lipopolysaccharide transport system ATP-binding protein
MAAIRVESLGKCYRVAHKEERGGYRTFREALTKSARASWKRLMKRGESSREEAFWALKDVTFDVAAGEVIGIIGRNGAGKSTLLKVLSRITKPTTGRVVINGRVGSLLEVGTGFHPELTGRENIYLNGSILGMSRREIGRKFDEIVAFAEVEKFLDTPVKRYSSGMYVRLAFAVAAHLDPEILVVDEVLAVGDTQFQKKCLGKMGEVASGGRTVLFVSHNMAAVEGLCASALLLSGGTLVASGPAPAVIAQYLRDANRGWLIPLDERVDREGSGAVRFGSVSFASAQHECGPTLQCGQDVAFILGFQNTTGRPIDNFRVAIGINDDLGQRLLLLDTQLLGNDLHNVPPGSGIVRVSVPRLPLLPGRYDFNVFATVNGQVADWVRNASYFDVEGGDYFGTGRLPPPRQGFFATDHTIQYERPVAETGQADVGASIGLATSGPRGR